MSNIDKDKQEFMDKWQKPVNGSNREGFIVTNRGLTKYGVSPELVWEHFQNLKQEWQREAREEERKKLSDDPLFLGRSMRLSDQKFCRHDSDRVYYDGVWSCTKCDKKLTAEELTSPSKDNETSRNKR